MSFLTCLARPSRAQAAEAEVAAASSQLLSQGPGAEAAALSGAVVSTIHDPTALYWNPAGLTDAGGALAGEHMFLFDGARYDFIGLSVPSPYGTFGAGALQLNRDNIVARQTINDPGTTVSNTQSVYMAGYGHSLGKHWSAGATANVLDFNIAGYSGRGWGLDAGTQGRYWADEFEGLHRVVWNVGADVKNLIEPSVTLIDSADTYPREFRAGAAMSFQAASRALGSGVIDHDRASVMFSFRKVSGAPGLNPAIGLEYDYLHILAVRLGYNGYLSTGFGIQTPDGRFSLDYSLSDEPFSLDHRFTLTYRFAPPHARPEEVYQEIIDREFQAEKAQALETARQDYAQGEVDFKNQAYDKAQTWFSLAGFLEPGKPAPEKALKNARKAWRLQKIEDLSSDDTLNPAPGQEEQAYGNIAALLTLNVGAARGGDKEHLLRVLSSIEDRVGPDAYASYSLAAFGKGNAVARRLLAAGHIDEAKAMADTLQVVESSATAQQVAALEEAISAQSSSIRTTFDQLYRQQGGHCNTQLARAALAMLRAFPKEKNNQAEKALEDYRDEHPQSIQERFYLQKLYYLAALCYARGIQSTQASGDLNQAQGYLTDILSDDPANAQAYRLLDAVSMAQSAVTSNTTGN